MADNNNSRTLTANFVADTGGFSSKINELIQRLKTLNQDFEQNKANIGFDFLKLGLQDVLLDPKTGQIYTPNMNAMTRLGDNSLTQDDIRAIMDHKGKTNRIKGAHGYFAGSYPQGGGSGGAKNSLTKDSGSGIMETGSDDVAISSIDSPIEQKHTGKGNPNAILIFDIELNNRQQELLDALPEYDSRIIVPKKSVNMADLSALTAKTGDEFAMFTNKDKRLVIRGNEYKVNVTVAEATALADQGYRWSGHTHPGTGINVKVPSQGDKEILKCFPQEFGVIYDSKGDYRTFEKE